MFTVGGYYVTARGRLAKILSDFKFKDDGNFQVAVYYPGNGWFSTRIKTNGFSIDNAEHNLKEIDDFKSFLTYCMINITFDHAVRTWKGTISDLAGMTIVSLTDIESQERTLKLLQLGAQEKILTWMQESGYVDDELEEGAE